MIHHYCSNFILTLASKQKQEGDIQLLRLHVRGEGASPKCKQIRTRGRGGGGGRERLNQNNAFNQLFDQQIFCQFHGNTCLKHLF